MPSYTSTVTLAHWRLQNQTYRQQFLCFADNGVVWFGLTGGVFFDPPGRVGLTLPPNDQSRGIRGFGMADRLMEVHK
jgi:hypothetical protein